MAALEAEVLLIGTWKNVEELEEALSLPELESLRGAIYDREQRHNRFMAAIKGIDLDEGESGKDKFEEVKRKAEARLAGKSEEELTLADMGIDIEVED